MTTPVALVPARGHVQRAGYIKHRLSSVSLIDLVAGGTPTLYTIPVGFTGIITDVFLECTASVGLSVPATAGVGIALGEDDLFASQVLTGFLSVGQVWAFVLGTSLTRTAPAGSVIKLGIDVLPSGTSQLVTAHVMGIVF